MDTLCVKATGSRSTGEMVLSIPAKFPPDSSGTAQSLRYLDGNGPISSENSEFCTNADTLQDARVARQMGAEGIGLCRTEHMFFKDFEHPEKSAERQLAIQEMILAENFRKRVARR